jgi:Uri superfamily endonuclease
MELFVLWRMALRGTYTLLLACKRSFKLRIGRLGQTTIRKGYYLYTGSALSRSAVSLEQRVARHRRRNKRLKWHIDYMTNRSEIRVLNVICVESDVRAECQINMQIVFEFRGLPIIRRAGSSDCKCSGHLLSVESHDSKVIMRRLREIYAMYGEPSFL